MYALVHPWVSGMILSTRTNLLCGQLILVGISQL